MLRSVLRTALRTALCTRGVKLTKGDRLKKRGVAYDEPFLGYDERPPAYLPTVPPSFSAVSLYLLKLCTPTNPNELLIWYLPTKQNCYGFTECQLTPEVHTCPQGALLLRGALHSILDYELRIFRTYLRSNRDKKIL